MIERLLRIVCTRCGNSETHPERSSTVVNALTDYRTLKKPIDGETLHLCRDCYKAFRDFMTPTGPPTNT